MKRIRAHRWIVLALFAVSLLGLAALETMAQAQGQARGQIQGQFFGFGEYPGGTLHTVFEIQQGPSVPLRQYATDITPKDGQYHMTETIGATLSLSNIQTGLGRRGAAAVAGGRFHFKQTPPIDMSPLGVLAEYGVTIEPNQTYYLPDGASLVTGEIELIAGVEAIKGTFTHPEYPTQRVILGSVIDPAISALLQYPIYMLIELEGAPQNLVQLIEFSFTPEEEL